MGGWTTAATNAKQNGLPTTPTKSATTSPDRLRGATHDLFELLERVQCSRLDDQRCVLPSYFTQVRAGIIYLSLYFHHSLVPKPTAKTRKCIN